MCAVPLYAYKARQIAFTVYHPAAMIQILHAGCRPFFIITNQLIMRTAAVNPVEVFTIVYCVMDRGKLHSTEEASCWGQCMPLANNAALPFIIGMLLHYNEKWKFKKFP